MAEFSLIIVAGLVLALWWSVIKFGQDLKKAKKSLDELKRILNRE